MDSPKRRKLRSDTKEEKRKEAVSSMVGVKHFGVDVTPFVKRAMKSGGSLDETSRSMMYGTIRSGGVRGATIDSVLPSFISDHIQDHKLSGGAFHQTDDRVRPRKSESYIGHQISSTRIDSTHGSTSDSKTISEPLSPHPRSEFSGDYHRAHAVPFSLVGEESNKAHTVWAPSWANITVDGHIEKRALKAANKGHKVYHFRFDTDTHSTVGFVSKRKGKTQPFKTFSATYERRD